MKRSYLLILLLPFLAASCGNRADVILTVSNPHPELRNDASILLTRGEIESWMDLGEGELPMLVSEDGTPLPCQVDDVDGDDSWDELFALVSLEGKATKKVHLKSIVSSEYPEFPARTNIRMGAADQDYIEVTEASRLEGISFDNYDNVVDAYFQMQGPAWENDLIGFRNYLDQRNGFDIFGKTTSEMALDDVGLPGQPSYHEPAPWGMDILKVGTSLGAGGLAYMYNDSLYRVGDNGHGTFKLIFEGPQRSRFALDYTEWMVEGEPVDVLRQVEIAGGKYYFQSTVTHKGGPADMKLVTGIVNMLSDRLHVMDPDPNHVVLFTHDRQAEDSSYLAMALMIPTEYMLEYAGSKDDGEGITQTYYAVLDSNEGEPITFRFYSLWEKEDPRWSSLEEVKAFLTTEAERWTQSVIYQVNP